MSTGITCTPIIETSTLIQPLLMRAVLRGEEFDITPIIDILVQDKIVSSLLGQLTLPEEFKDLGDVICLMLEMNKVRSIMAVLRGEQPPEGVGVERVLELVINLQLLSQLSQAFGGGTTETSSTAS